MGFVLGTLCVTPSLVVCECFVDHCLSFLSFFFLRILSFLDLLILITSLAVPDLPIGLIV